MPPQRAEPFLIIIEIVWGRYSSGQRGQTVNLLTYVFTGSNPVLPTKIQNLKIQNYGLAPILNLEILNEYCGSSSVGRAIAFQAIGREFEPRLPLKRI